MSERILHAPAKINLTLEVLARREDGYHGLRSVMLPLRLADEIAIAPAVAFSFHCDVPQLEAGNLVVRALTQIGLGAAPYAVWLRKHIPVGAGLGGGSSDAAAILKAAAAGELGPVGGRDWLADARALGSDVPFFLCGTGALVEATGERVTALGALPAWSVVLLVPDVHVDTSDAYRRLAAERRERPPAVRPRAESASLRAVEAVQRGDLATARAVASNDFEALITAGYPAVREALAALRDAGAEHALLSGSGGAVFALCADDAEAHALADRVRAPGGARLLVTAVRNDAGWLAGSAR